MEPRRTPHRCPCRMAIPAAVVLWLPLVLTGCSSLEPWVMPYERANLADPVMLDSRHGSASVYINHVYDARESARGATGGSGGGCGCN